MAFVSGLIRRCFQCASDQPPVLVRESWDGIDRLVVGAQTCATCGAEYLFTRRPTPAERDAGYPHLHVFFTEDPNVIRALPRPPGGFFMFAENCPLRLNSIYPRTETIDGETRKRAALEFFAQPFKADMARDLDIHGNLYMRADGGPIDDIVKIELAINVPVQRMTIRRAPDGPPTIIIDNVKVSDTIKVRRDKEGPVLAATFGVDFAYPSPDDLLFLFTSYTEQVFVTFETMQGSLGLSEPTQTEPPEPPPSEPAAPA